jgi:hypothetical protein
MMASQKIHKKVHRRDSKWWAAEKAHRSVGQSVEYWDMKT